MFKLFNCLLTDSNETFHFNAIIVESDDCPDFLDEDEIHLFGYTETDLDTIIKNGGIIEETGEILIDFAVYDEY